MPETIATKATQKESRDIDALIHIRFAVKTQGPDSQMGVGIYALNENNQLIAQWAIREFSVGNSLMDNVVALKLVGKIAKNWQIL